MSDKINEDVPKNLSLGSVDETQVPSDIGDIDATESELNVMFSQAENQMNKRRKLNTDSPSGNKEDDNTAVVTTSMPDAGPHGLAVEPKTADTASNSTEQIPVGTGDDNLTVLNDVAHGGSSEPPILAESDSTDTAVAGVMEDILTTLDKLLFPVIRLGDRVAKETSSSTTDKVLLSKPKKVRKFKIVKKKKDEAKKTSSSTSDVDDETGVRKSSRDRKLTERLQSEELTASWDKEKGVGRQKSSGKQPPSIPNSKKSSLSTAVTSASSEELARANGRGVERILAQELNDLVMELYPHAIGYWSRDYGFYRGSEGLVKFNTDYEQLVSVGVFEKTTGGDVSWCVFGDYIYVYSIEQPMLVLEIVRDISSEDGKKGVYFVTILSDDYRSKATKGPQYDADYVRLIWIPPRRGIAGEALPVDDKTRVIQEAFIMNIRETCNKPSMYLPKKSLFKEWRQRWSQLQDFWTQEAGSRELQHWFPVMLTERHLSQVSNKDSKPLSFRRQMPPSNLKIRAIPNGVNRPPTAPPSAQPTPKPLKNSGGKNVKSDPPKREREETSSTGEKRIPKKTRSSSKIYIGSKDFPSEDDNLGAENPSATGAVPDTTLSGSTAWVIKVYIEGALKKLEASFMTNVQSVLQQVEARLHQIDDKILHLHEQNTTRAEHVREIEKLTLIRSEIAKLATGDQIAMLINKLQDNMGTLIRDIVRDEVQTQIRHCLSPGVQVLPVFTRESVLDGCGDPVVLSESQDGFKSAFDGLKSVIGELHEDFHVAVKEAVDVHLRALREELQIQRSRLFSNEDLWKMMDFVKECNSRWTSSVPLGAGDNPIVAGAPSRSLSWDLGSRRDCGMSSAFSGSSVQATVPPPQEMYLTPQSRLRELYPAGQGGPLPQTQLGGGAGSSAHPPQGFPYNMLPPQSIPSSPYGYYGPQVPLQYQQSYSAPHVQTVVTGQSATADDRGLQLMTTRTASASSNNTSSVSSTPVADERYPAGVETMVGGSSVSQPPMTTSQGS